MNDNSIQFVKQTNNTHWTTDFLYSKAFTQFLDLIPEAAILSTEDGKVIISNSAAQKTFMYSEKEFKQKVIEDLVPASIKNIHAKFREWFFQNPEPRYLSSRGADLYATRKDGYVFPMESALFSIQTDQGTVAVNLLRDITEQTEQQAEISKFAFVDHLTNLPNRRYFEDNFQRGLARAHRHKQQLALLFIDLDNYKPINDEHGHEAGDAVLHEIGLRLCKAAREEDFIARIGGDEFIVLVYPVEPTTKLEALAERIIKSIEKPIVIEEQTLHLSASIGIAYSTDSQSQDKTSLLAKADGAMYEAKKLGGGCYQFANQK
jgi:diguanylate cyclase (GGDEF)-like protein/PAS domain S-box-containing protein